MVIPIEIIGAGVAAALAGAALLANEAKKLTKSKAAKDSYELAFLPYLTALEMNIWAWKQLFEGEVTVNDDTLTSELELASMAEQIRLKMILSSKNAHDMVDFSVWKLKLPSDSVIIDYPVDLPKDSGVTIFPKQQTEEPKVEGVPAIPQNPTVILENPPEIPDFRVYEPFPELAWDMGDNIIAIEGAGKSKVPEKVNESLEQIEHDKNAYLEEHYGGIEYRNQPNVKNGETKIPDSTKYTTYTEYDVNKYKYGTNRGGERIVTGNDGSAWYTPDHYKTWFRLK